MKMLDCSWRFIIFIFYNKLSKLITLFFILYVMLSVSVINILKTFEFLQFTLCRHLDL